MKRIYLDFAAAAPLRPSACREMMRVAMEEYGNPSSVHANGRSARHVIEKAREDIAGVLNCAPANIFFLPSATAANNIVLYSFFNYTRRVLTTKLEHPSVMKMIEHNILYRMTDFSDSENTFPFVPLNGAGQVDIFEYQRAIYNYGIRASSVCMVCSETGIINPIFQIGDICSNEFIYSHTDATQTVGHIPVDVKQLNVDYVTFGAHKFGGPRGVGVLYSRFGADGFSEYGNLMYGGHQEHEVWPGTENTAAIAGAAAALKEAVKDMDDKNSYIRNLRTLLVNGLKQIPGLMFNSFEDSRAVFVAPGIVNVSIPGINGTDIVMEMDEAGISISSGSACSSGENKPSAAIMATAGDEERARSSVRFSFDETTTAEELEIAVDRLSQIVKKAGAAYENN